MSHTISEPAVLNAVATIFQYVARKPNAYGVYLTPPHGQLSDSGIRMDTEGMAVDVCWTEEIDDPDGIHDPDRVTMCAGVYYDGSWSAQDPDGNEIARSQPK